LEVNRFNGFKGKKVMLMTMMMTLFAASAAIGMWGDGNGK
jgi:hypothetical protein